MAQTKIVEAYIPGLNKLMRDLRGLDKEAQGKLRDASTDIAARHMVPAWQAAARSAGPWGERIAGTVRTKRDRLPAISIGGARRAFSGGASVNMVRYPSHAGRVRDSIPHAFTRTGWMQQAKPAYIGPAIREWGEAVDKVVDEFNRGPDL